MCTVIVTSLVSVPATEGMAKLELIYVVNTPANWKHFHRWRVSAILISAHLVICSGTCMYPHYVASRRGFYCDNNVCVVLQGMVLHHCKLVCLRKLCAGLSYNFANGTCLIHTKPCVNASLHPDYELILFQPSRPYPCIRWVDSPPLRYVTKDYQGVARNKRDNQWVPGKHLLGSQITCTVWASAETCGQGAEYLEVGDHCSVAWVPYTAGDPVMAGAVLGSTLSDGTPLYVVNLQVGEDAYGYYRPDVELGYAGRHGEQTRRDMEMLIIV